MDLLPGLEERPLEWRGARIRVFAGGAGPRLLLVHGLGGAAWNFSELAPLILPGRRLLVPDLPGHGGSSPLPEASTLAGFADALAAVCRADGPGAVDVVGHSLGGAVAVELAVRHPELVRRLLLAAPAGISGARRSTRAAVHAVGLVRPGRLAGRYAVEVARSRRLRRIVFGLLVSNPDALGGRAVHGFLDGPPLHADSLAAGLALVAGDQRRQLEHVRCETLVLWGARDRQVPLEDGVEYARRLRAPLRVIADCGHLLIGERPDVCAAAVGECFGD